MRAPAGRLCLNRSKSQHGVTITHQAAQARKSSRVRHRIILNQIEPGILNLLGGAKDISATTEHTPDLIFDRVEQPMGRVIRLGELGDPACTRALELDGDIFSVLLIVINHSQGVENSAEGFLRTGFRIGENNNCSFHEISPVGC